MHEIAKDISGAGKSEMQLTIGAPIMRVWQMLLDIERWPEFTQLYEFVHWTSSERWGLGSSFEAEITLPFPVTLKHVVTACQPHAEIRWLVLGNGIVVERWTRFAADGRETKLTSSALYFGTATRELPGEVGDVLAEFTQRFFNDLKAACERRAA